MRRFEEIGTLCLMAARAHLDLGGRRQQRILGRVQRVTARAGHVACRVGTARPIMGGIQLMATETLRVLPRCRRQCLGPKVEHARERTTLRPHMCPTRSVTGLALQAAVTEGAMRIIRAGVLGAKDPRDGYIVMATQTGVRSLGTVRRIGLRWPRSLCCAAGLRRCVGRKRGQGNSPQQSERGDHAGTR